VHVAPGAATRLDAVRTLLDPAPGVLAAASARGDVLILRFLAAELAPLRATVARFLPAFRAEPLPRVWSH
jgi:urease accessory protein